MGLFDQFPYTNFHELNLMWILKALKEIKTTTEQFVAINSLKYADPIQWNITGQYEKNTIVIDPLTGTAYISVQPVPNGVALTNEDYWTVVFDLGSFVTKAAKNFTDKYEPETTLTATFPTAAGEWLIWGDTLYKALVNITAGDSYVVDGNIRRITIEEVKNTIMHLISDNYDAIIGMIGSLDDLTTTAKDNLVAAINELASGLSGEVQARQDADDNIINDIGDLNDLDTTDKHNIVAAINESLNKLDKYKIYNVLDYGADTAAADNSEAFNNAINAAYNDRGIVYIPNGTYNFTQSIVCKDKISLIGESMFNTVLQTSVNISLIDTVNVDLNGVVFSDFALWQNNTNKVGRGFAGGSTIAKYNSARAIFKNLVIHGFYDGINGVMVSDGVGIFDSLFINIHVDMCGNGINVSGSGNVYIHLRMTYNINGFYFTHMNDESYDGATVVGGVFISNDYDVNIIGINRPINFIGTWFEQATYGIINCPHSIGGYGIVFRSCMFNSNNSAYDLFNMVNYTGLSNIDDCTVIQTVENGNTKVVGVDNYRYVVIYRNGTSEKFSNIPTTAQLTAILPIYRIIECTFNNTDVVTITHDLGRAPINIQLTPATNLQGHSIWVSDFTATTFNVHIDEVVTLSAFFYAQIR